MGWTWVLWMSGAVFAEEEQPTSGGERTMEERLEDAHAVVTVYSDTRFERLERAIEGLGYKEGRHRKRGTVFRPDVPWHPSVWLLHDGGLAFAPGPVRLTVPLLNDSPHPRADVCWLASPEAILQGKDGVPTDTPQILLPDDIEAWANGDWVQQSEHLPTVCADFLGLATSERRTAPKKRRILEAAGDDLRAWQESLARVQFVQTLIARWSWLQEVWALDAPAEDRRALLLDHWCSRLDSDEGHQARELVEKFLQDHVQTSDTPLTADEVAWARARCWGEWTIDLPSEPLADVP